jgi:beta-glucanase (GH16 family)
VGDPPGPWALVFDSEFGGTSLNTGQWSSGWFGSGITKWVNSLEQDCYDPAEVSESGGSLNLTAVASAESCDGTTEPYASGIVTTYGTFSFTYGYAEARIWLPGSTGIEDWPAFWALGQDWPTGGEIDVVEGLGGQACAHYHAPAGNFGNCSAASFTNGWHTFAADWEPGSVTFYYDGQELGQTTTDVTSVPMFLILNLAVSATITSPDVAPATMKIAYVRVWQH